jgi:hypothetical protein
MTTVTEDKRLAFAAAFIASMLLISLALAVLSGSLVSMPSPGQLGVAP